MINSEILGFVTSIATSFIYDTLKKQFGSDVNKQINEAFNIALSNYYPKNDTARRNIEKQIKQSVIESAGFTKSSIDKHEVYKTHPDFFKEFEGALASKQIAFNYILELRNQARHKETEKSNQDLLNEMRANQLILMDKFSSENKKNELVKPFEDQISQLQKSLEDLKLNDTLTKERVEKLFTLQNNISLILENWNVIAQNLKGNEFTGELIQKVAQLFLDGKLEDIIESIPDSLFKENKVSNNENKDADSKQGVILDLLVIKANVFELLDKPRKARSLYLKLLLDLPPKNVKHYTKAQLHFFNNQELNIFHSSIFKQNDLPQNDFGYTAPEIEQTIERAIVYNSYNKMLYQNQQSYLIDSKERKESVVEETIMSSLIPLSETNILDLFFNYYWDSYRIIRYLVASFDFIQIHFERLKKDYREMKFDADLVEKIGYYGYTKLFYFDAKIYQKTKHGSFIEEHDKVFNEIGNLNDASNFGNYLALSTFGLFNSVFAILEGDLKTAQKFSKKFSVPLIHKVNYPNGISIDKKKILYWEFFYGQMVFIELGLKIATTIKEYEVLLNHSQSTINTLMFMPRAFSFSRIPFEINNRALLLQAKVRIQIYELTRESKELDRALSCLFMSQLETKQPHPEGKHIYISTFILFKIWEKKFPEIYKLKDFKGKDIMGEASRQKAKDIWKEISVSDQSRLKVEFPDFSFNQFVLK